MYSPDATGYLNTAKGHNNQMPNIPNIEESLANIAHPPAYQPVIASHTKVFANLINKLPQLKRSGLSYTDRMFVNPLLQGPPNLRNSVVLNAKSWLNTPYKWGGNDRNGVDCSGLTKNVYGKIGVNLPRTAREQFKVGLAVSFNQLQPGDQVFFGKKGVHHTGIYIGNGQYLHAPKTNDRVKISNLSGRSDFAGARRHYS